jgi:hypothetical protein
LRNAGKLLQSWPTAQRLVTSRMETGLFLN